MSVSITAPESSSAPQEASQDAAPRAARAPRRPFAPSWLARLVEGRNAAVDALETFVGPLVSAALRIWLAQAALAAGAAKAMGWELALYDAANAYPAIGASPEAATALALAVEFGAGALLLIGLFTRPAAIALFAIMAASAAVFANLAALQLTALALLYFIVFGPGALSVDAALGRGAARLPLGPLSRAPALYRAVTRWIGPLALLSFRAMAAALALHGLAAMAAGGGLAVLVIDALGPAWAPIAAALPALGPLPAPAPWAAATAAALAILTGLGLFSRPAAIALLVLGLAIPLFPYGPAAQTLWLFVLALIALRGPGALSLDAAFEGAGRAVAPIAFDGADHADERLPHVVIIGAGFAGVEAAKRLRHAPVRVTLIDRRNYHLFQPLLYQVATAALSPADIATPIRELFRGQRNLRVLLGRVTDIDPEAQRVFIGERRLSYDHLIVATGARHSYFGNDQWEGAAPGLKKIDDATDIRRRVLLAFEMAESAETEAERRAWLTFAVVGGGPTGVEMAGAIAELAHTGLAGEFTRARPEEARVLLIEGGPRVLRAFPEDLSAVTAADLARLGVEVVTEARVTDITPTEVVYGDRVTPCRTVVWAAGVVASPAAKWLGAEADRAGRAVVDARLRPLARRTPESAARPLETVYVVGDTALSSGWAGQAVPGLAPAAKQGGAYAADAIARAVRGKRAPKPFAYAHAGSLATIGRAAAVADLNGWKLTGAVAWWFWGAVHVLFLANARSRLAVAAQWAWAYLTYRRSTRLITGPTPGDR